MTETLQLRLEATEKEKQELKELTETGKKYREHLQAVKFIRLAEGDNSPLIRLVERADVATLKELVETYEQRAKGKFKASAVATTQEEEQKLSSEWLMNASYAEFQTIKVKTIFQRQAERLMDYATKRGYKIVAIVKEDFKQGCGTLQTCKACGGKPQILRQESDKQLS